MRCIIEHLTDDKNTNKLVSERLKIPSKFQNYDHSSDEDENEAEKWEVQYLNQKKSEAISNVFCLGGFEIELCTRNKVSRERSVEHLSQFVRFSRIIHQRISEYACGEDDGDKNV